jgi:hypothetical protein
MSDNDDDFDPELLVLEIMHSVDCEQDNDPLNRIVTVEIDMFAERKYTGVSKRYGTKFPTAQMKLIDVDLRYHRIVDCD